jgi:hypothetical protein
MKYTGIPMACERAGSSLRPRGAPACPALERPGGGKRRDKAERRPERTKAGNCEDRLGERFDVE